MLRFASLVVLAALAGTQGVQAADDPVTLFLTPGNSSSGFGKVDDTFPGDFNVNLVFAIGDGDLQIEVERYVTSGPVTYTILGLAVGPGGTTPIAGTVTSPDILEATVPVENLGIAFYVIGTQNKPAQYKWTVTFEPPAERRR